MNDSFTPSSGGLQRKKYIPEGDLYRLIIRSKLPAAVQFEEWVCDVVLPSIRQHGAYITTNTLNSMRDSSDFTGELLERLSLEHSRNDALMEYLDAIHPKAKYCDNVLQSNHAMPISVIAKDYGMTAIAIAFNRMLHDLGIQYRIGAMWLLYKEYANKGYTVYKTYSIDGKQVSMHTCWTQKGRFFLYEFLAWHGILPEAERSVA